jgi:type IV pilus biogenesis protein CpaD/CtpE
MMSHFTRSALIVALLLGVAACTSKPVMNIENRTPTSAVRNEDDMRRAILSALQNRQWTVERADRGNIMALIQRRSHQAEITIPYSVSSYSIRYRDSQNLGYKNGKIHRNYNNWIHNLDRSIQQELNRASF